MRPPNRTKEQRLAIQSLSRRAVATSVRMESLFRSDSIPCMQGKEALQLTRMVDDVCLAVDSGGMRWCCAIPLLECLQTLIEQAVSERLSQLERHNQQ